MNREQKAYTTFEAARICHVTHHSIKNWIRQGLIKASRTPGGHYRILEKDLDEFREKYDMFPKDASAKKYKIMVVDDDPEALQLIENILGKDEYEIIKVSNATEVGIKSVILSPDVILLDFLMPEINGFEVCRALRNNDITKNIPIMAVTCLTKESDIERIFACGADEYLAKPFKVDQLIEKVKELVTKGRPVQK